MKEPDYDGYNFSKFQDLAKQTDLSRHEKVGFPDSYRENQEELIFKDISTKLTNLAKKKQSILEIGPGCSKITRYIIERSKSLESSLFLIDGKPMLDLIKEEDHITKIPGKFPEALINKKPSLRFDIILAYSVFQYPFSEGNAYKFLDICLEALKDGGQILIGDIPNISMRKRFFASAAGISFHQNFTGTETVPDIKFNQLEVGKIDDSFLLSIIARARSFGYNAWIIPQGVNLNMANRREDILITKP